MHESLKINETIFTPTKERDKNLRSNNATHADARHADLWLIVSQIATISLKSNYGTPKIFYNAIYL